MKKVLYYIKDFKGTAIPVCIRPATNEDYLKTRQEHWRTSWKSKYIQNNDIMARSLLNDFVKGGFC